jgi:putative DNA primase/helicase
MNAIAPLRERARGRWPGIPTAIGIDPGYLTRKNGPCPICRDGRDRWRFFDTNGDGTWNCRYCGGGLGIDLVMKFTGLAFKEAAQRIEMIIGADPITIKPKPAADPPPKLRRMWRDAKPTTPGDMVDTYLRSRGVGLDVYPSTIRTAPSLRYYADDATSTTFPAMLAAVRDITGKAVTIHRTYLAADGSGKAPVGKPRKIVSKHSTSPHVRLTPVAAVMGIAEGIETALSASKLFNIPTWSVLSTYGIETFELPVGLQRLIVFADHDANGAGQKAAHMLAARLAGKIPIEIRFPETPADDWNDVLRRR